MKIYRYISLILIIILSSSIIAHGENLGLSAESYILIDGNTGRVLYERDAHRKMPMASTTKK